MGGVGGVAIGDPRGGVASADSGMTMTMSVALLPCRGWGRAAGRLVGQGGLGVWRNLEIRTGAPGGGHCRTAAVRTAELGSAASQLPEWVTTPLRHLQRRRGGLRFSSAERALGGGKDVLWAWMGQERWGYGGGWKALGRGGEERLSILMVGAATPTARTGSLPRSGEHSSPRMQLESARDPGELSGR